MEGLPSREQKNVEMLFFAHECESNAKENKLDLGMHRKKFGLMEDKCKERSI